MAGLFMTWYILRYLFPWVHGKEDDIFSRNLHKEIVELVESLNLLTNTLACGLLR